MFIHLYLNGLKNYIIDFKTYHIERGEVLKVSREFGKIKKILVINKNVWWYIWIMAGFRHGILFGKKLKYYYIYGYITTQNISINCNNIIIIIMVVQILNYQNK